MHPIVLYIAAAITGLWGMAHLLATRGVVTGFGRMKDDDRLILIMEWIVEGVALLSLCGFVVVATLVDSTSMVSSAVYSVAAATLTILAVVSLFSGFRVEFVAFRLCPFIFLASAAMIAWGAWF